MLRKLFVLVVMSVCMTVNAQSSQPIYVVYVNEQAGLSIVSYNDGVFGAPQPFVEPGALAPVEYRLQPSADKIAVFRRWESNADLTVWGVPSGDLLLQRDLVAPDFPAPPPVATGDRQAEMWRAIGEMSWSPDGNQLAFVSAGDGQAAAVYLADFPSANVRAISSPQGANGLLEWSPGGQWLVMSDLETFAGEAGFLSTGVYAWHQSGDLTYLEMPAAYPNDVLRVGWRDGETLVLSPRSFIAGARGLYGWHIPSGTVTSYLPETLEITVPVYAAVSDTAAFVLPDLGMSVPLRSGLYLLPMETGEPQLVVEGSFFRLWLAHGRYFQIADGLLIDAVTLEETVLLGGDIATFVSPAATVEVAYFSDSLRISSLVDSGGTVSLQIEDMLPPDWLPNGTVFVTQAGANLVAVDVIQASVTELGAINGPWAIVGETR